MLRLLNLANEHFDIAEELRWIEVMDEVHVDSMTSTQKEGFRIVAAANVTTNLRKHQSPGVDRLQITSGHLQDQRCNRWTDSDDSCASLSLATSLIYLRSISWHIQTFFD